MGWPTGELDSFRVEEVYNWHDDVMEIARHIVHEADEARLSNIAHHFEVDLSEIRAFLEMKKQQQLKPQTNADRIRAMTDEELAKHLWNIRNAERCVISDQKRCIMFDDCIACWLDWLKQEAE